MRDLGEGVRVREMWRARTWEKGDGIGGKDTSEAEGGERKCQSESEYTRKEETATQIAMCQPWE